MYSYSESELWGCQVRLGVTLGGAQSVTEQIGEASEASSPHEPASLNPQDAKLLESIHVQESLSPEQVQQLKDLVVQSNLNYPNPFGQLQKYKCSVV